MELDVDKVQQNGGRQTPDSDIVTVHCYQTKLPVRASSEKHSYKRHSWLLPEGQTVVDKENQLSRKKRNSAVRHPSITFYLDLCILFKNLLRITCDQFEEAERSSTSVELQETYRAIRRQLNNKEKKVTDLHELYLHQQHMREGALNLISSLEQVKPVNKSTKQRIDECRSQKLKNIERLLSVEDELNVMAGTLKFQILGLIGFSRVCPGDVYEVSFKLANQRWKSKCKIEALGQKWIDPEFCFQARPGYDMSVKMFEIGALGKKNVIGAVGCAVQEFLHPTPQVYMLPINANGTMKLKLGVVWSPLDATDQKGLSQFKKPTMPGAVDFSNTAAVNLRATQDQKQASPYSQGNMNGDYLNQSWPLQSSSETTSSRTDSNSYNSPQSASRLNGTAFNYNTDNTQMREPVAYGSNSSSLHRPLSRVPSSPKENVISELKHQSSFKQAPKVELNRRSSGGNSNLSSSHVDSGYHSSSHEDLHQRRYSSGNINGTSLTDGPPKKSSSSNHLAQQNNIPETGPVYNAVRMTTVPIQVNAHSSHEKQHIPNGIERNKAVKPANVQINNNKVNGLSSPLKAPPAVKPKPKLKKKSDLGPIIEEEMNDEHVATTRMIELCKIILTKLENKPEITKKIRDLTCKLNDLKMSLEELNVKQNRRPSLTESIASALDSFAFLKDDDEHSTSSFSSPLSSPLSSPSPIKLILPKQWKLSHRALCHHLYMLYDAIVVHQSAEGPLNEKETYTSQCIFKQKFYVNEFQDLISTPENIELAKVCKQFSGSNTLANTWEVSASPSQPLYCTSSSLYQTFCTLYQHLQVENGWETDLILKEKVCKQAIQELSETNVYGTDENIFTLFQFVDYFKTKVRSHSVLEFLGQLQQEEVTLQGLRSKDDLVIMSVLQQFRNIPVVSRCIHVLLTFLVGGKPSVVSSSVNAVVKIYQSESKDMMLKVLLSALEDKNVRVRAGACIALGQCKVQSSSQRLIHLYQHDETTVKDAAEAALKYLGRTQIRR